MKKKVSNGFTLVEVLIALAVFAIFTLLVNSIFFNILRSAAKQEALKEVRQSGDLALTVLDKKLREATLIESPSTCPFTDESALSIRNLDGSTTVLDLEATIDGVTRLRSVGGSPEVTEYLTSTLTSVNTLNFTCDASGSHPLITIYLNIEHKNNVEGSTRGDETASVDFQTSTYLRNAAL